MKKTCVMGKKLWDRYNRLKVKEQCHCEERFGDVAIFVSLRGASWRRGNLCPMMGMLFLKICGTRLMVRSFVL